ncbi:MAG: hypothetical protein AAF471_04305 [Myxococcota bacterium]
MRMRFHLTLFLLSALPGSANGWAEPNAHLPCHPYCVKATLESGFTSVLTHTIQWGENGTEFDYVQEGGQSVLLPYWRPTLEVEFLRRHSYVDTDIVTRRDVRVDDMTFPRRGMGEIEKGGARGGINPDATKADFSPRQGSTLP